MYVEKKTGFISVLISFNAIKNEYLFLGKFFFLTIYIHIYTLNFKCSRCYKDILLFPTRSIILCELFFSGASDYRARGCVWYGHDRLAEGFNCHSRVLSFLRTIFQRRIWPSCVWMCVIWSWLTGGGTWLFPTRSINALWKKISSVLT